MSTPSHPHRRRRQQRGTSLLEALAACFVLAAGMIGLARLQHQQHADADAARQRTDAIRLAQDEIEAARHLRLAALTPALRSWNSDGSGGGSLYRIERTVSTLDAPQAAAVAAIVSWTDRRGSAQRFELQTIVADPQPALRGALLASGASSAARASATP